MNRLNELIAKTTLELLQSVLPTNIMTNLEQLDAGIESEFTNDLDVDTDRLLFEHFLRLRTQPMDKSQATTAPYAFQEPHFVAVSELNDNGEQNDNNSSLTYFEIVEQEMMRSVPVTKDNIMILSQILGDFPEINANLLAELKLQTAEQLTNLLVYALMSGEKSHQIEQTLFLESGTVNKMIEIMTESIAQKKEAFIQWPNDDEILQNVRDFQCYHNNAHSEFRNVFGAIGTIDIPIKPALPRFYSISQQSCSTRINTADATYTPIKWQCSCDTNGFLQSSLVLAPKTENQSKNSYVFEVNPIKLELANQNANELHMVADETLTIFTCLLTPHEKRMIDAVPFNETLESKRIVIDRTFEKIQRRFMLLNRIEHRNANSICNIIETIGILHNFLIIHRDDLYIDSE